MVRKAEPAKSRRGNSNLINPDLAPIEADHRTWGVWHIASLWVGMSVCIPTYLLAASMIKAGLNWWQSLLAIILGNVIVLIPLVLNAHAGTKYGIPFPVLVRASYGVVGAHIPSLLRSVVACGWFGIQTWIGGTAINAILIILWSGWRELGGGFRFMGHGAPEFLSFLIFWLINMYFVWAGHESIKWLETVSAPLLILAGLALLYWAVAKVGGLSLLLATSDQLVTARNDLSSMGFFFQVFVPWLTAMVGYWATLSLNIPDFTRFARSQKDQMVGQAVGLLTTMPLFAFVGVAVTSATVLLYGEAIWNPVDLLSRLIEEYHSPVLGLASLGVLTVATLSTNIAANVVASANSFSNLAPTRVSFRMGGLLAGLIGIAIFPWKLLEVYQTWLIGYSGLLGAVGGVIICDYFVIRRRRLLIADLYRRDGVYAYDSGCNRKALWATAAGIAVVLPGRLFPSLAFLFDGAWFFATGTAFVVYYFLMKKAVQ